MATATDINYERFAEDVFFCVWVSFRVPRTLFSFPKPPKNDYPDAAEFLKSISRGVLLCQIFNRHNFYEKFESDYKTSRNFYRSKETMSEYITEYMAEVFNQDKYHMFQNGIFSKIMQSFALHAEISLFLLSKNTQSHTRRMPQIFHEFFSNVLMDECEENGGLKALKEKYDTLNYIDAYLDEFITKHCIPYTGENLYKTYMANHPNLFMLKEMQKRADLAMARILRTFKAPNEAADVSEGLDVHPLLGIVPHEMILARELQKVVPDDANDLLDSPPRLSPSKRREMKKIKIMSRLNYSRQMSILKAMSSPEKENNIVGSPLPLVSPDKHSNKVVVKHSNKSPASDVPSEQQKDSSITDHSSKQKSISCKGQHDTKQNIDYSAMGARPKVRNIQVSDAKQDVENAKKPKSKLKTIDAGSKETKLVTIKSKNKSKESEVLIKEVQSDSTNIKLLSKITDIETKNIKSPKKDSIKFSGAMSPVKKENLESLERLPLKDAKCSIKEENFIPKGAKSPTKKENLVLKDMKSQTKKEKLVLKADKSPAKKENLIFKDTKSPNKKENLVLKDTKSPNKKENLVLKDAKSPNKKENLVLKDAKSPDKKESLVLKDAKSPNKKKNLLFKDPKTLAIKETPDPNSPAKRETRSSKDAKSINIKSSKFKDEEYELKESALTDCESLVREESSSLKQQEKSDFLSEGKSSSEDSNFDLPTGDSNLQILEHKNSTPSKTRKKKNRKRKRK